MRFVVYGAGAVGGVVGARLHLAGHEVVLVARGAHLDAIRRGGLRLEDGDGTRICRLTAIGHPRELVFSRDDVVLLAVKSQDTAAALDALAAVPGADDVTVACLQNGVANEREALRRFARVVAVCVMCPAGHLEPGLVTAYSAPIPGLLDLGLYPGGTDATCKAVAAAFGSAGFESAVRPDAMRWKHRKLLLNLGNAVEALCGRWEGQSRLAALARAEGEACLAAAGIDVAGEDEDRERRAGKLTTRPFADGARPGSSTVQSLVRGAGSVETDHLNGEIVLLGRLHGVPTPANALLQRLMRQLVRGQRERGSWSEDELLALLDPAG